METFPRSLDDGANERARIAGEIVSDAQQPVAAEDVESDAIVGPDLLEEPGDMFPDIHAHDRRRIQLVVEMIVTLPGSGTLLENSRACRGGAGGAGVAGAASLDRETATVCGFPIVLDLKVAGGQSGNRIPVPVRDDDAQLERAGCPSGRKDDPAVLPRRAARPAR